MKFYVYRHFDAAGTLLYVGQSLCAATRTQQHRWKSHWFDDVVRIELERHETLKEALIAERVAIDRERPAHNIAMNPTISMPIRLPLPQRRCSNRLRHWIDKAKWYRSELRARINEALPDYVPRNSRRVIQPAPESPAAR